MDFGKLSEINLSTMGWRNRLLPGSYSQWLTVTLWIIDSPVHQVHCLYSGEIREYTISGSQHEAARLELPTTSVTEKRVRSNLTGAHEVFDIQSIIT